MSTEEHLCARSSEGPRLTAACPWRSTLTCWRCYFLKDGDCSFSSFACLCRWTATSARLHAADQTERGAGCVKMTMPTAFTVSMMAWSLLAFPKGHTTGGTTTAVENQLR